MKLHKTTMTDFYESDLFTQIYDEYYEKLYLYVFNILKDEDDTFDVIQDIFINLEKKLKLYDDYYALSTFLYKIAYNAAVTKYRKNKLLSKVFWFNNHEDHDYNYHYAVEPENMEEKQQIETLLQTLSLRDKTVIHLKYFENMSSKEVAEILQIKSSYVDVIHSRVLSKLKSEVQYGV